MRISRPTVRLSFLPLIAGLLAACGQVGDLYLPPPEPKAKPPAKAVPAVVATPEDRTEQDEQDASATRTPPRTQDANR